MKKFKILNSSDLSQIQMWMEEYNTVKGNVVIESPLVFDHESHVYVCVISHNE